MPPPGGMAGMGDSFFGFSATMASVVISGPAIEAASCRAVRTTFGRVDAGVLSAFLTMSMPVF